MRLENMNIKIEKWIIGTGFSRGIGRKLADKIKAEGFNLLHIGRTPAGIEDEFIHWDLSQNISVEFMNQLRNSLQNKDIFGFIYSAGIIPNLILEESLEARVEFWKSQNQALQINYLSCLSLSLEVLPFLLKQRKDSSSDYIPFLANVCSLAAVDPLPNFEYYGLTKQSTLKQFENFAKEYNSKDLLCLSIHPGTVKTEMLDDIIEYEKTHKNLPIVDALKDALEKKDVILPEESAEFVFNFLFDKNSEDLRHSAHGKLFLADSQKVW